MKAAVLMNDARSQRFILMSSAFMFLMGLSCCIEEWILKNLPGFDFYWTVAFIELAFFAVAVVVQHMVVGGKVAPRCAPMSLYFASAVCLALSQSLGKEAYRHLNYATGTIVKSGKLVPTIAVSVIWLRRSVPAAEWLAAILLVASAGLMALGESIVEVKFNPVGLVISLAQLIFAAFLGNIQERILRDYNAPISEAMLYSNGLGMGVVFVFLVAKEELVPALSYFYAEPMALVWLLVRSATFFAGGLAVTALTKEFGTAASTAVGTARKSITVLLSFALFPKPFHVSYVYGVIAFLLADLVYLHVSFAKAAARSAQDVSKRHADTGSYELVGRRLDEKPCGMESLSYKV